jgi:hypothetical protein
MEMSRRRRTFWSHALSFVGGLVLSLFGAGSAFPEEPAESDQAAHVAEQGEGLAGHATAPDAAARNRALSFGFVMLGVIIVGGTLLLALVVIWGNRTRRMALSPLPPVSKRDELWFLKPKKGPDEGASEDVPSDPDQPSDSGKNSGTN